MRSLFGSPKLPRCAAALAGAAIFLAAPARAELYPLWEAGAGLTVLQFPYYRGSDQSDRYVFPVPYVVYRGPFLKVDRQKVRGLFFESDYGELDVSINGSPPVRSRDIRAREGMPDLDGAFEIGPSANIFLAHSDDGHRRLDLRLPLRKVFFTDLKHIENGGWLAQPQVALDYSAGPRRWNFGLTAGVLFGDARYHDYFYGVDSIYARPDRPAYQAHGGYAGAQLIASLSKRFEKFWFGSFVKYDNLAGADFDDSPLVRTRDAYSGGVAVTWVFAQSEELVEADQ
ncbi:MAG: MipA/OmpV family protein [Sinimarinibacterium sp.]|jgi:outer membrane scaffolding protein for murein synthesis (MipA/OmpV family)